MYCMKNSCCPYNLHTYQQIIWYNQYILHQKHVFYLVFQAKISRGGKENIKRESREMDIFCSFYVLGQNEGRFLSLFSL